MHYWLLDIEADEITDSEVHNRISAALLRAGIQMPHPIYYNAQGHGEDRNELNKKMRGMEERIDALCSVDLFNTVYYEELVELAEKLVYTPFAKGDVIARNGTVAPWLSIVISGSADVFLKSHEGVRQRVGTINDGNLLGELGLMTGEARPATIIAQTEILAYRLDKEAIQPVLEKRPELAVHMSKALVSRRVNIESLRQKLDQLSIDKLLKLHQNNILEQIREFYNLNDNATIGSKTVMPMNVSEAYH